MIQKTLVNSVQDAITQQQQIRNSLWDLASIQAAAEQKATDQIDSGSDD